MAQTTPSQFRLSAELLKRLDRHAERLQQKAREAGLSVKITRTDALRSLLEAGLDAAEAEEPKARKRKRAGR